MAVRAIGAYTTVGGDLVEETFVSAVVQRPG